MRKFYEVNQLDNQYELVQVIEDESLDTKSRIQGRVYNVINTKNIVSKILSFATDGNKRLNGDELNEEQKQLLDELMQGIQTIKQLLIKTIFPA